MSGPESQALDSSYPHTIENGGGEQLTFMAPRRDDRGEYLDGSNVVAPGAGPPMHVHHLQEESLTVERGRWATSAKVRPSRAPVPARR